MVVTLPVVVRLMEMLLMVMRLVGMQPVGMRLVGMLPMVVRLVGMLPMGMRLMGMLPVVVRLVGMLPMVVRLMGILLMGMRLVGMLPMGMRLVRTLPVGMRLVGMRLMVTLLRLVALGTLPLAVCSAEWKGGRIIMEKKLLRISHQEFFRVSDYAFSDQSPRMGVVLSLSASGSLMNDSLAGSHWTLVRPRRRPMLARWAMLMER